MSHLSSWEGVKGQVWGSIPTGNNPPAMRESRGEGLRCICDKDDKKCIWLTKFGKFYGTMNL